MSTMTSEELIKQIADSQSVSYKIAKGIVYSLIETILQNIKDGKVTKLAGFGQFEPLTREARNGINPKTLAKIEIPAKKTMKFVLSSSIKYIF